MDQFLLIVQRFLRYGIKDQAVIITIVIITVSISSSLVIYLFIYFFFTDQSLVIGSYHVSFERAANPRSADLNVVV